ncbi:MAG: nucleoside triphosphate pyrophosphohydrolase [Actinomycetota bacterium]
MARILLVLPSAGAPEVLPLEQWHALTTARAFATDGDVVAERLRELGYDVTPLSAQIAAEVPGATNVRKNLLAHAHGDISEEERALARRLAEEAATYGEIAFIGSDDGLARAVMERALEADIEVEFVIGRQPRGHRLLELVKVMARLRGPGGCPWDAEQTHATLAKHLVDETYELLDAIESGDESHIAEELGDLLLQVVFHAQMGADAGEFDVDDVAQGLMDKLIRRHPHVFGDVIVSGAREVVSNWDAIKEHEKERDSVIDGVPESLPALAYAQKLQRRAGSAGFDWRDVSGAIDKVREEAGELATASDAAGREDELGDLLFAVVALGRHLDVDAETALRGAAHRFRNRVLTVERLAKGRGRLLREMSHAELLAAWAEAKAGS